MSDQSKTNKVLITDEELIHRVSQVDETSLEDIDSEPMYINIGPTHPATHGTFRVFCKLDGERIEKAAVEVGYLHRGFEKIVETKHYTQVIPYTDRLNYSSGLANNVGFCKAVERMLGVAITPRTEVIRVLVCEIQRIMDHMICVGANLVDIGALTNFWYFFNAREKLNTLLEALTGARLTYTYVRIGGLAWDLPHGFEDKVAAVIKEVPKAIKDVTGLVKRNRIFIDRARDVGVISDEDAISYGYTGPCLRASGVDHDLRKKRPYYRYDEFDFDVPLGDNGDTYDRIFVRIEEMWQSLRIIEQALQRLPGGPINIDDKNIMLPPKDDVHNSMEALINHFKLVIEGVKPPQGEIYDAIETPNGELGFYIISDGSSYPYRIKCRPPCFYTMNTLKKLVEGSMVADIVAILGGLNVIAGELDR
ncbi:MAG: NADH dehydrogenase (quinone) subunit D [Candidatus Krumholzibacteria bacterium]|nr:NADH dehydrogenase (quinone) subunit D [Candidatus Krumholzibacteria bacterium]